MSRCRVVRRDCGKPESHNSNQRNYPRIASTLSAARAREGSRPRLDDSINPTGNCRRADTGG